MDNESRDSERLWTIVEAARAVSAASSTGAHKCDDAYTDVMQALKASPWQLNKALSFRPTLMTWCDRAHVYFRLRRQVKLLTEGRDSPDQKERIAELTKSLGLLDFGAAVNETWYRRLEGLVASGAIAIGDLQKLLGSIEVATLGNGDLVFNRFHTATRLLIGAFFVFWLFVSLVMLIAGFEQIALHGPLNPNPWYCFSYFLLAVIPTWGGWWSGPSSWISSMKLKRLLSGSTAGVATA